MNIFEQASREAIRFATDRGELTTEQLWNMPLQSKNGFDLDTIAKAINTELRSVTEDSFVSTRTNPAKPGLELKLDIVKHIIATKLHEAELVRSRAARAAERNKLLGVLAEKQDEELKSLTPEQITARLDALKD